MHSGLQNVPKCCREIPGPLVQTLHILCVPLSSHTRLCNTIHNTHTSHAHTQQKHALHTTHRHTHTHKTTTAHQTRSPTHCCSGLSNKPICPLLQAFCWACLQMITAGPIDFGLPSKKEGQGRSWGPHLGNQPPLPSSRVQRGSNCTRS